MIQLSAQNKTRLILVCVALYWIVNIWHSSFEAAHLVVGILAILLTAAPDRLSKWKHLILPLLFTTMVYDSQRFYADYIRGPIRVVEPYAFDLRFFGIEHLGTLLTPNEWWQKNTTPALDIFSGIAYLSFIPEFFLVASFFMFFCGEKGSRIARSMTWGFFWLNILGYSTYYWYAAAPPWYVADHGLVAADLSVKASLAGCVRFDEAIGIPVFKTWYGHSADVFGAIPSLHVAYPFLAFICALRMKKLRIWSLFFYGWVSFAAVYLNHHYILDILWGTAYAILIGLLFTHKKIMP